MNDGPINVLLVEDNLGDARLLQEALAEIPGAPFTVTHVKRLSEGLRRLAEGGVHVVLLDLSLPDASGLETVRRTHSAAPGVPIVVLTGLADEGFSLKAVREGAQDYLVKGHIDGNLLVRSMRYAIERERLMQERQQAEKALQASQEYALNIIESSLDMIIAVDSQRRITEFNQAAQKSFGYAPEEILGRSSSVLYADPEECSSVYAALLRDGTCVRQIKNVRKNGEAFSSFLSASVLRDARGELVGIMGVSRDITQQLELEGQLRHNQKMESIGQLAGGIAHDFNNLLTVIQGHASVLLASDNLAENLANPVHQISFAAERAASLTRQLLAFSRKQAMNPVCLDLNELVANMSKMFRRILGEDVALQVNYSPHPATVRADAGMLEQVLLNLAVNARDAMPKGGQLIINTATQTIAEHYVERHAEAGPDSFVCLSVTDSGCGIPPQDLPHIFEPFFTTKEIGKGTGLGLATVYGIVKQHQGWVTVDSAVGRGTTFQVFLPGISPRDEHAASGAERHRVPGGQETILVVEDDLTVRALVTAILQNYGYKTLEAACASSALEIWREQAGHIDLLLADIVMPGGLSGRELAETLIKEKPGLKVILTSGYSREPPAQDGASLPRFPLLHKPFRQEALAQAVRDCLDPNPS